MTDHRHLILIDSSGFAHRAFRSQQAPRYRESDGFPTGTVLRFTSMLWRLLGAAEADRPSHGAAVFDPPGKTFRHRMLSTYKANRGPRHEELDVQLPVLRHAAETLGLTPIEKPGWEADDVLATLATRAKREGIRTTIISGDKDLLQMVEDDVIEIVDPMAGKRMRRADVIAKFGVPPELICDFQGLRGDDVDNIPGVPGCGDERAAALIRRFGDLESVLENADKCRWPQVRAQLKRHADDARLSKRLATLRRTVPLDVNLDALTLAPPMVSHLKELLRWLEAPGQFDALFNLDPQLARPVDALTDPGEWWREELIAAGQPVPDLPQCGYYQRRLDRGAPFVPARIWRELELGWDGEPTGREVLLCEVDGRRRDPVSEWSRLSMNPIKKAAYDFETADIAHARRYRPGDPKATPERRIDILAAPAPHNPKKPHRSRT